MSKTHMNRLSRAEKALGLVDRETEPAIDPERVALGRTALIRMCELRLDRSMTTGELADLDAQVAAGAAKIVWSEQAQAALEHLRETRCRAAAQISLTPLEHLAWPVAADQ